MARASEKCWLNTPTTTTTRIVCPRSERWFSVPVWVWYTGHFMVGPHASVCSVSVCPVPQGVLPGGPRCVSGLGLSLAPSSVLRCPMLGFSVASTTLAAGLGLSSVPCPTFCRLGFCTLVGGSACALWLLTPSSRVVLTEAAGLARFLVLSIVLPGHRSASRSPCSALPPVSRLFFGLGPFSFGWGFGLCLTILLATFGCRCACCDLSSGCESARVLPSLLGPSPSGVCHLSHVCSSVGGPVGVAHLFHPSLLLGGGLVRFCGGLCWRSLAMFWACPHPFLCVGLVDRSRRIVAPLAQCLCWRFPSSVHVSLMQLGVSPCVWFRRGPWGVAVAPPISPYTGPAWSPPICRATLELRSVFPIFLCDIPHVYMAIILSVSLTPACPFLVFTIACCSLDTWIDEWLGWLSVPLLALPGFCHLRWLKVTTVWSWCILR